MACWETAIRWLIAEHRDTRQREDIANPFCIRPGAPAAVVPRRSLSISPFNAQTAHESNRRQFNAGGPRWAHIRLYTVLNHTALVCLARKLSCAVSCIYKKEQDGCALRFLFTFVSFLFERVALLCGLNGETGMSVCNARVSHLRRTRKCYK